MSTDIAGLVDRVYREYLEPMDDLTSYTVLNEGGTLTASDTVITFNGDLLSQEEEDAMDAGTIIECERELMRCVSLDTVNNQVTVVRGVRGTTAAEHADGSVVKIAPPFPRKVVFDAVVDQINNLFPTLFAVDTQSITTGTGYTLIGSYDAPGTHNYLVSILSAISQYTDFSAGSINFFLNVTCAVCPDAIPANCIACTVEGPVVYVIVLDTPSLSVYVNGLGNSTSEQVTGEKFTPVVSEPALKSVYCDIALSIETK